MPLRIDVNSVNSTTTTTTTTIITTTTNTTSFIEFIDHEKMGVAVGFFQSCCIHAEI